MNPTLLSDINNTINKIDTGEIRFLMSAGKKTLGIYPSINAPQYFSDQEEYFSFYLLRNLLRGLFLSINSMVAGKNCLEKGLFAPATMLFYNSAFHSLNSYLSINGIVLTHACQKETQKTIKNLSIKAMFSSEKKNWTIEKFRVKHTNRWLLLEQVFKRKGVIVPDSFTNLFNSFYNPKYYKQEINNPLLKDYNYNSEPITFHNKLNEFLKMIANQRHFSVYQSFGSTSEIFQEIINRDSLSDRGIDANAITFSKFANEFFDEVINTTTDKIVSNLTLENASRSALIHSVFNPWFDEPRIELLPSNQRERVEKLYAFLGIN